MQENHNTGFLIMTCPAGKKTSARGVKRKHADLSAEPMERTCFFCIYCRFVEWLLNEGWMNSSSFFVIVRVYGKYSKFSLGTVSFVHVLFYVHWTCTSASFLHICIWPQFSASTVCAWLALEEKSAGLTLNHICFRLPGKNTDKQWL